MIEFVVPSIDQIMKDEDLFRMCNVGGETVGVPVLLIRSDGVVFPTGQVFAYKGKFNS